jgi:PAS domain-containing protein
MIVTTGGGSDAARRVLADKITEEVLQLLYTAHQDLAEIQHLGADADPQLAQSAQECTLGAISILRVVVSTVLTAAWGPSPPPDGAHTGWGRSASLLFDAMSDAWVVTCSDDDLLYASEAACRLLGRTSAELKTVMRDKDRWPAALARSPRVVKPDGDIELEVEVPLPGGGTRNVHVMAHPLPAVAGVKQSYISLLAPRA